MIRYWKLLAILFLSLCIKGWGVAADTIRFGWEFSPRNFYLGVRGGVSFYSGTFSSLGGEGTVPGWKAEGLFGYAFNDLLSVRLEVGGGGFSLLSRGCCHYFLGEDGKPYYTPVCGMSTVPYEELSSKVSYQYLGAGVGADLFSLIPGVSGGPFSWSVSVGFHAMSFCAQVKQSDADAIILSDAAWRFFPTLGMGVGYKPLEALRIQVYGNIGFPVGGTIDGIPAFLHRQNMMWEIGLGVIWNFLGTGSRVREYGVNGEEEGGYDGF